MKKTPLIYVLITVVALLGLAAVGQVASAQTGNGYDLTWWTVDNGGSGGGNTTDAKQVTGGDYTLLSTAGQHDADPAHNGQVSGGSYSLRSGFWPGENLLPTYVYLPIVLKSPLPDLVGTLSINPTNPNAGDQVLITVEVTNQGSAAASAFWVDFYINPSGVPLVNQRWDSICGISPCKGIAWLVPAGLQPGDSVTLTSNSFDTAQSRWPDHPDFPNDPDYFVPGTSDLYIYVDSWNPPVPTGGVVESNEDNNRDYLGGLSVSGLQVESQSVPETKLPLRPAP